MGNNIKNYVGIIIVLVGALMLIFAMIIPPLRTLLDFNAYTLAGAVLILAGVITHVRINKKNMPE